MRFAALGRFWQPVTLAVLLLPFTVAAAAATAPPPPPERGLDAYLAGLDALESGVWDDAESAFARAIGESEDSARYRTARAVARVMRQDLKGAAEDAGRAKRLAPQDPDAVLWDWAVRRMAGDFAGTAGSPRRDAEPFELLVRGVAGLYGEKAFRRGGDPEGRYEAARRAAEEKFPLIARGFADRAKSSPALRPAILLRGRGLLRQGDYTGALRNFHLAGVESSADPDLLNDVAACEAVLGDVQSARERFSRVLILDTDRATFYLGRAGANARLGGLKRARADLQLGRKFAAQELAGTIAGAEKELAAAEGARRDQGAAALLESLKDAARAGRPWEDLVAKALAVHKAANARRLRLDETYQDGLRALEDAVRAEPGNPDRLVAAGRFLTDGSAVPGERVEPRGAVEPLRWQPGRAADLARAEEALDRALAIKPDHAPALVAKATTRFMLHQYADSKALVDRALAADPENPEVLKVHALFCWRAAGFLSAEAASLRTPTFLYSTREETPDRIITRSDYRDPTGAELRRADALDAEARQLREQSAAAFDAAIAVSAGTPLGYLLQAERRRGDPDPGPAEAALREALKLDPAYAPAHEALIDLYRHTGRVEQALEQEHVARNLSHTTAGPLLKLAWLSVERTAFKAARDLLARAAATDPADARATAYLAVVAAADGRGDESLALYQSALALEEARVRLRGASLDVAAGGGASRFVPTPDFFGLTMTLRLRVGAMLLERGRVEEAMRLFRANLALGSLIPTSQHTAQVVRAMLPDPELEQGVVPSADTTEMLLLRSQAGVDYVAWARDGGDGKAERAAAAFRRLVLQPHENSHPDAVRGLSELGLAGLDVEAGDYAKADEVMKHRGSVPQRFWQEMRSVERQARQGLSQARERRNEEERRQFEAMTPERRRRGARAADVERLRVQKRQMEQELADPDLPERERRLIENGLRELDRAISARERPVEGSEDPEPPAGDGAAREEARRAALRRQRDSLERSLRRGGLSERRRADLERRIEEIDRQLDETSDETE